MQRDQISDLIAGLVIVAAVMVWVRPNSNGPTLMHDFWNLLDNSITGIIGPKGGGIDVGQTIGKTVANTVSGAGSIVSNAATGAAKRAQQSGSQPSQVSPLFGSAQSGYGIAQGVNNLTNQFSSHPLG